MSFKRGDIIAFVPYDEERVVPLDYYLILDTRSWYRYDVLRLQNGALTTIDKTWANGEALKVG